MTTPSGAQSGAGAQLLADAGILAPADSGSGGDSSRYGLGNLSSIPINLGGLFGPVDKEAVTAEDAMDALSHASPSVIAQVQSYLWKGGFYGSSTAWTDINIGVLNPRDIDAFKAVVKLSAQTVTADPKTGKAVGGMDLSDYLRRQAAFGVYQGVTQGAHASRSSTEDTLTLSTPDPKALGSVIDAEYKRLTGRKPSPSERAGFVAAFTAAHKQLQISNFTSLHPGTGEQGPGEFSTAAPQYEQVPDELKDQNAADTMLITNPGITDAENARRQSILKRNAALHQTDQEFLALADQPMPGMGGAAAGGASALSTVNVQEDYNPTAFADEYIRNHNLGETGAHDATGVFSMFLNMISGGVQ